MRNIVQPPIWLSASLYIFSGTSPFPRGVFSPFHSVSPRCPGLGSIFILVCMLLVSGLIPGNVISAREFDQQPGNQRQSGSGQPDSARKLPVEKKADGAKASPTHAYPVSMFNKRFPVMALAKELAEEMEEMPADKRNDFFLKLPGGLRMFVTMELSLETTTIIREKAYLEFMQRFPEKKVAIISLQEKCRLFDPIFHEASQSRRIPLDLGMNFLRSLSPEEAKVMGEIDGYLLGPTLYLQHHETAGVTPAGIAFLKSRAPLSPAARQFLEILEKEGGEVFRPERDFEDGFFFVRKED